MEKNKGTSFGLGRGQMQKIDQERDIIYHKETPSPSKYSPLHPGKELSRDSVKFSFQSKAHSIGCKYLSIHLLNC